MAMVVFLKMSLLTGGLTRSKELVVTRSPYRRCIFVGYHSFNFVLSLY